MTPRARVKTPPHSSEAEMGVLGSMLQEHGGGNAIAEAAVQLSPEQFYVPAHQTIFTTICDLYDESAPSDFITLTNRLRDQKLLDSVGGAAFITELFTFVPTAAAVGHYIGIVRDKYVLRQAVAAGTELVRRAYEEQGDPQAVWDEIESKRDSVQSLHGRNGAYEGVSLIDYAQMNPVVIEGANLLGKRWLCRKGIALLNGATGVGKSSTSVQAMLLWSLEREAFGIKPVRPLKFLYVQAENDDGDMYELVSGVCDHFGFSEKERDIIRSRIIVINERSLSGDQFLAQLRRLIRKHKPDIAWIDPLQAFAGGDLKDPSVTTAFLRNGLNPILDEADCAAFVSHHSTKTIYHDTSHWTQTDWNYFGAGGAEIANVPRAILNIEHTTAPGVFKWHAGKRWERIGWADEEGIPTAEHIYCWHKLGAIYWREAEDTDLLRVESAERQAKGGKNEEDLFRLVPIQSSIPQEELFGRAQKLGIGINTARGMLKILIGDGKAYQWLVPRPRTRPEIHIARFSQPEP